MIKYINDFPHVRYEPPYFEPSELEKRAAECYKNMDTRRTVREFSNKKVPRSVIEHLILTASTAPSGAHKQPWTFCAVEDASLKSQIRAAAEAEERASYGGRMSEQWLRDLAPLGTDWEKPFLETAPWLLIVFAQATGFQKEKH